MLVSYACDKEFGSAMGCGHQGSISPFNGAGKLQWKVDWPARWHAFGVSYEMFGKDLIESAEVGDKIVQKVFRGIPPQHMFYELFLDEQGRKISKSKGTGMTAEEWLRYGTHDSLMYLMLDKPREAKGLYPAVIPRYMDMTAKAAEGHFSGEDKLAREARHYHFITLFKPPAQAPAWTWIDFPTLTNLIGNVGLSDPAIVEDYLRRSRFIPEEIHPADRQTLHDYIRRAKLYYDEVMRPRLAKPEFDAMDGYLLSKAVDYLESGDYTGEEIHFQLFEIPKSHGVEPSKFFRALYFALIKQERGPRAGNFVKLLGQTTAAALIRQRLAEYTAGQAALAAAPGENQTGPGALFSLPLSIAPEVRAAYPALCVGIGVITGIKVENKRPAALQAAIAAAVEKMTGVNPAEAITQGPIAAYRDFFQSFGANPNAMLPSPENMLRMAVFDKRLPGVNNVVDASNLTVLETGLSVALYDLDKVALPLSLRFSQVGDEHLPIGAKEYTTLAKTGELVYADEAEVICRALNHRDSDKTKITLKTQSLLVIVDGPPGISVEAVRAALDLNLGRIQQYGGGEVMLKAIVL
jgi:DNA/RNA-binding domain of Phe-tRNA-synthetase-like protein